jgi:hypothetical protein
MLARNPKILKDRRNARKRLRRYRARQKNGDILLRLTLNRERVEYVLEQMGLLPPNDDHAKLLLRAVTGQATTTTSGWAADLARISYTPLPLLTPASAAGRLAAAALPLEFDRVQQTLVPRINTPPIGTWVAENSPHAMVQAVLGSVLCGPPRKILFGAVITRSGGCIESAKVNDQ